MSASLAAHCPQQFLREKEGVLKMKKKYTSPEMTLTEFSVSSLLLANAESELEEKDDDIGTLSAKEPMKIFGSGFGW